MALEGTIRDFGLPEIFQLIGLQRKTGVLTLSNDKETVTVTFENGMVVNADSSSRRLEDRLGNVLVKQGKLGRDRLEEALAIQKQTLQRLGHILSSSNYITSKDLKEALQVQVAQIVFKCFRWRDGNYNFGATDAVDWDRDNFTPMSADFILMEGIRMVDEWPIIEKKIRTFDLVFRKVVDASLIEVGPPGAPGETPAPPGPGMRSAASSASKIRLTQEEERVYRRVDGVRTVQVIIDASGSGEFEVCRTLFDLLNRNIIAPLGRGVSDEAEEEAPPVPVSLMPGYVVSALAVLLALVGVLAQLRSPFAVTGLPPFLGGAYGRLMDAVGLSRLERLDQALQAYHLVHGAPPGTLDELVTVGLVDRAYLQDPFHRPYRYEPRAGGYRLLSPDESGPGAVFDRALPSETP